LWKNDSVARGIAMKLDLKMDDSMRKGSAQEP